MIAQIAERRLLTWQTWVCAPPGSYKIAFQIYEYLTHVKDFYWELDWKLQIEEQHLRTKLLLTLSNTITENRLRHASGPIRTILLHIYRG